MHALTGNPDVATGWLTVRKSNGTMDGDATAQRTKALIDRATQDGWILEGTWSDQWEDDWSMLSAEESIRAGKDSNRGTAQAAITSGVLNAIGTTGDTIELTTAGRNSLSIALSNYVYGVQQSASPDGVEGWTILIDEGDGWAKGMPLQPVIARAALTNLLGQVGMDDYATTRFIGAQEAFNKQQVAGSQGKDEAFVRSVYHDQSNLRGYTAGAIARQSKINGADADEKVGAWARATKLAINAIPLPQTKGAGVALDVGTKFALGAGKSVTADGTEKGIMDMFGGEEDKKKDENQKIRDAG